MQMLLDDNDIKAGFTEMEAELMRDWKSCFDPNERENLWRAVQGLERLQTWMRSAASYDRSAIRKAR